VPDLQPRNTIPLWLVNLVLALAYGSYALWSLYRGGAFGYHDLSLINDFFSNAWSGRPFWITDEDVSHLSIHFTPTLVLLFPFFLLSDSQALFLQVGLCAVRLAGVARLVFRPGVAHETAGGVDARGRFCGMGGFCGFECLYARGRGIGALRSALPLFASAALVGIVRGIATKWCVLFTVLAAGVRPDGKLFLAVQAVALLFLPRTHRPDAQASVRRVAAVSATGLLTWSCS
jgi:hypothetical protein